MPYTPNGAASLYFEQFGDPNAPPLLLFGGFTAQLINFPSARCEQLAAAGLSVVRLDIRDAGLSTHFGDGPDYSLSDCADDVVAVADAFGYDTFHVLGACTGGMIAQVAAIEHPDRIRSLISVQATTGESDVGQATQSALAAILDAYTDDGAGRDVRVQRMADLLLALANGPQLDADQALTRALSLLERDADLFAIGRRYGAVITAPDRTDGLRSLQIPVLVLHGNRDPYVAISGGRRTAALVPHAKFVEIDEMGHYLSERFWDVALDEIVDHVASVERIASG